MSYTTHEAANAFPMMDGKSLGELTEDIRKNGLKVPVALYEGKVLDGRNRMLACNDAGVRPDFQDITSSVDDPYMWVWSLNGERRHLGSQEQKALIWRKLHGMSEEMQKERARIKREADKARSEAAKGRERNADGTLAASGCTDCTTTGSKRAKTREAEAKAAGVNKGALARADALLNESPEYAAKVAEGEMSFSRAKKEAKAVKDREALKEASEKISEKRRQDIEAVCDIRVCSCAELFASGIRPDAVVTDPPYPREFLPVFTELAESCKRAEVPVVAVMSGQSYVPEVISRLCEHLEYRWTMAYMTPGGQAVQQWEAKVNTSWKPVFIFGESASWFGDVAVSKPNNNDKRFHGWGQSESGMLDLIGRITKPGDLVCDPFVGGGTTAVAALASGREFVGCDIDPEHVANARARVIS